jgi:hypothetical protein
VIPGHINKSKGAYGFLPDETRKGLNFTSRAVFAFAFGPEASFCGHCNMVWSKADATDAAKFIEKHGSEGLKAQFAVLQQTQPPAA